MSGGDIYLFLFHFIFIYISVQGDKPCIPKLYGSGKMVCVCNSTYCDTLEKVEPVPSGQYLHYISNNRGLRFSKKIGNFTDSTNNKAKNINITETSKYQTIIGFGAAFTDAAGINIKSLSKDAQDNLLKSYFSPEGIELNIGRVPIAGTDFSTHTYTYDDIKNDTSLTHFNLTEEDILYKIPLIKEAQKLSEREFLLLSAAWSAPPWMKTNDDYSGFAFLKDQYYQAWADYHIKFLDAYKEQGLEFWAVSTGNEPSNGIIPFNRFNSLGWTPHTQRRWIAENFGPALKNSSYTNVKILALDDQRFMLPWWINILMEDEKAASYIDGIAVHWYWDAFLSPQLLDDTQRDNPEKFILATEACVGDKPWEFVKVDLGSWSRAEAYMNDIIQDLSHWVTGWIDWNLALNLQGGPNWAKNYVDAAVIVNATSDEFYKQPMFYAIGHFSKFVKPVAVCLQSDDRGHNGIKYIVFENPDKGIVIIIYNEKNRNTMVTLSDPKRGYINISVQKRSFNTIIYW